MGSIKYAHAPIASTTKNPHINNQRLLAVLRDQHQHRRPPVTERKTARLRARQKGLNHARVPGGPKRVLLHDMISREGRGRGGGDGENGGAYGGGFGSSVVEVC